jgi:hypothetical protein
MLRPPAGLLKSAQSSYKLMQILDLSCVRVVSVAQEPFYRSFAMSNAVTPIQSRRNPWTDDLMLNKRGVPLGNLRNVVHALREQGDGCL